MCQNVDLSGKIAVQNVGCVSAYFCAEIIVFDYKFGFPLRKRHLFAKHRNNES